MMDLMKKNNSNLPATKGDLNKLEKKLGSKVSQLGSKVSQLDGKIDGVEKTLRAEIKITAQETKEEIKEEMKQSESRVLDVLDKFLKEVDISRQERTVDTEQKICDRGKLENHEKRIMTLEQRVFSSV